MITFAVIGGGATGVEIAGAIAELTRVTMLSDFRKIDPRRARILLLEAGPRLLPNMDARLSECALSFLHKMGVEVHLNTAVSEISKDFVVTDNKKFSVHTAIWSAGVRGSALGGFLETPLDRNGKVLVNEDLSVPNCPQVFVVGDLASFKQPSGKPVPGVAPAAIQQGEHAAKNILQMINGKPTEKFQYVDKGNLATIGRSKAVAELGRLKFSGFPAWVIWLCTHIFFLIGFRNRFVVLIQWAWAYMTFHSYSRLITYPWKPWSPGLPDQQIPEPSRCSKQTDADKGERLDGNNSGISL